jgi:hypothetical protein
MPREMPHIKQEAEMEEEDETNPTTAPESTEQHHDWSKHYAELLVAIHEQTMEMKQLSSVLNNIVTVISTMLDRYD